MAHSTRRYMALTDPDDHCEGEVRLGAKYNDYDGCYEGGQLIFRWTQRAGGYARVPPRVCRIVDLANKALEAS